MQQQFTWTSTNRASDSIGPRAGAVRQFPAVMAAWVVASVLLVGLLLAIQGVGLEGGSMADVPQPAPQLPTPMPQPGPGPG